MKLVKIIVEAKTDEAQDLVAAHGDTWEIPFVEEDGTLEIVSCKDEYSTTMSDQEDKNFWWTFAK